MDNNKKCYKKIFVILLHDLVYSYLDPRVHKEVKSLVNNTNNIAIIYCSDIDQRTIYKNSYEKNKIKKISKEIEISNSTLKAIFLYIRFINETLTLTLWEKPDADHYHEDK